MRSNDVDVRDVFEKFTQGLSESQKEFNFLYREFKRLAVENEALVAKSDELEAKIKELEPKKAE